MYYRHEYPNATGLVSAEASRRYPFFQCLKRPIDVILTELLACSELQRIYVCSVELSERVDRLARLYIRVDGNNDIARVSSGQNIKIPLKYNTYISVIDIRSLV